MAERLKAELEIGRLWTYVRERGLMLYPVLIYLLAKVLNETNGRKDICPNYAASGSSDTCFYLKTAYDEKFSAFYQSYIRDWLALSEAEVKENLPSFEDNLFHVSFREDEVWENLRHRYPAFILGQPRTDSDKVMMPVSVLLSGNTNDVAGMIEDLQRLVWAFEAWIEG